MPGMETGMGDAQILRDQFVKALVAQ